MRTYQAKPTTFVRKWVHVDATDQVVGRLAAKIAMMLMGKHRPTYTYGVDTGDFVVVTNVEKVRFTGRKPEQKVYRYHTQFIGGLKETSYETMHAEHPDRILGLAVRRMLPKSDLGRHMFAKLKMYAGSEHPHAAQKPETVSV